MQSHSRMVTREPRHQTGELWQRVTTTGALLAIATAVIAGAVLTVHHNRSSTHSRTAAPAAAVDAPEPRVAAPARFIVAPFSRHSSWSLSSPTLYLAGSTADAERAHETLDEAAVMDRTSGSAPASTVIVSPGVAVAAYQAVAEENQLRVTLGLREISVVDLRDAAVTGAPAARRAIANENSLRVSLGLPEIAIPGSD